MKRNFISVIVFVIAMVIMNMKSTTSSAQGAHVSFNVFYNDLAPYGEWVDDTQYGYVWVPQAGVGFRPYYTDGHWVMTEDGNMWVSDYPWGWAPFHYGRWTYDSFYGWVWLPDNVWGPAWVTWRSNADYYGWAPLGPGITYNMAIGNYYPPDDWWVFIPPAYIHHPHFHNYYYGPRNNVTIIRNTTIINNTTGSGQHTYIYGPRPREVENITHQKVAIYNVADNGKPGRSTIEKNTVNIYHPSVEKSAANVTPVKSVKAERPIEKPQPVSVNDGKPQRFSKTSSPDKIQQNGNDNIRQQEPVKIPDQKTSQPADNTGTDKNVQEHDKNDRTISPPDNDKNIAPENKEPVKTEPKKSTRRQHPVRKMQQPAPQQQQPEPNQQEQPKRQQKPPKKGR